MPFKDKKRIIVLASGKGSNLQAVNKAIHKQEIKKAEIVHLISDRTNTGAESYAHESKIPATILNYQSYTTREDFNRALKLCIDQIPNDLILALGFMRLLSKNLVEKYKGQMINIHPSLLPSFPGTHAIKDALAYGVRVSGSTIHFIDKGMDTGPIIRQEIVWIKEDDDLASLKKSIQAVEHQNLIEVLRLFCDSKIYLTKDNRVIIKN